MELYSKPKKCSLYYNGFYMGSCYSNGTIFFKEVFSISLKVEVILVFLIIIYGQKAIETLLKKESSIPFGGIILAVTWGAFHFISRGVGFEIWNGISTMIFSVLSGVMYLRLNKNFLCSYLFIAIGYLL